MFQGKLYMSVDGMDRTGPTLPWKPRQLALIRKGVFKSLVLRMPRESGGKDSVAAWRNTAGSERSLTALLG